MVSLEQAVQEIDMWLGGRTSIPNHVVEFRDALAAAATRTAKDSRLELFLERKETDDWEEASKYFFLSPQELILVREAGQGSFGVVYKAFDRTENQMRAVKFLERTEGGKPNDAYRMLGRTGLVTNEKLPDAFRHEGIVKYYASGRLYEKQYLVFEWIYGETLDKIVPSVKHAASIIRQTAEAVRHMHKNGYAHNDLRLQNIMLSLKAERPVVTVLDYSIATPVNERGISIHQGNISSREIAAPESILRGELSVRSDIWALGHLLYRLRTGEHAFPHADKDQLEQIVTNHASYAALQTRVQTDSRIPEKEKAIILKSLSYDSRQRYQSVDAFLAALDPPKTTTSTWSLGAGVLGIGLASLGCLAAVCAGILYRNKPEPEVITTPPTIVEVAYSEERKVQRNPRIDSKEPSGARCDRYHKSILQTDPSHASEKYQYCMSFRTVEAMLDRAQFIEAAQRLEELEIKYPKEHNIPAAEIEAYYELGLLQAASAAQKRSVVKCDECSPMEFTVYGMKVKKELTQNTTVSLTPELCTLASVRKEYAACKTIGDAK